MLQPRIRQRPLGRYNAVKGIGAVLVFAGIACLVTGAILSCVAFVETEESVQPAFIYVGPVLMITSLCFLLIGYIFGRIDIICYLFRLARRARQYDGIEEEEELEHTQIKDSFCFLCFRCILCCCRHKQTTVKFTTIRNDVQSLSPTEKLLYDSPLRTNDRQHSEKDMLMSERESKLQFVNQYLESIPSHDDAFPVEEPEVLSD